MPDQERFFAYKTYKAFKEALLARVPCWALKEELMVVYSDLEIAEYHIEELYGRIDDLREEKENLMDTLLAKASSLEGPDM